MYQLLWLHQRKFPLVGVMPVQRYNIKPTYSVEWKELW